MLGNVRFRYYLPFTAKFHRVRVVLDSIVGAFSSQGTPGGR